MRSLSLLSLSWILLSCNAAGNVKGKKTRKRRLRTGGKEGPSRISIVAAVALEGGSEFDDPNSYQNKALDYVLDVRRLGMDDRDFLVYYALACVYYASYEQPNKWLERDFPSVTEFSGWNRARLWMSSADKCHWDGITCNRFSGTVTEIKLFSNNMNGILAPEIQYLAPSLEVLDVYNNPYLATEGDGGNEWMGEMTNLRVLSAGTTSFEYSGIPPFINKMSSLVELNLSNTRFQNGPIHRSAFRGLPNLQTLDLSSNTYTTTVPEEVSRLPNLQFLYLDGVIFQTEEPQTLDFLVGMPSIFECFMDGVQLSGGIPAGIGQVSTLGSLSLTSCGLDGVLPRELGSLASLERLWLYDNNLRGNIPSEMNRLQKLEVLRVEGNQFSGRIRLCDEGDEPLRSLGSDCSRTNCPCCTCCGLADCQG